MLRRVRKEGEEKEEKNKVTMRVCRVSLCEENVAQVVIIMSPSMTNVIIFFKVEPIFLCHRSSFLNYFFCSVILKIFGQYLPETERRNEEQFRLVLVIFSADEVTLLRYCVETCTWICPVLRKLVRLFVCSCDDKSATGFYSINSAMLWS